MGYEWGEHVGELDLHVTAATEEGVFAAALDAVAELLAGEDAGELESRELAVAGGDRASLFAAWIDELAFLAETEGFVPVALDSLTLGDDGLAARVGGRRGSPPHLVKAVTYHRLVFERAGEGWRATAVLDV